MYSVSGRLVASVFEGRLEGGPTTVAWDGLDSRGRRAASGVYFARAEVDGEDVRSKLVLLR